MYYVTYEQDSKQSSLIFRRSFGAFPSVTAANTWRKKHKIAGRITNKPSGINIPVTRTERKPSCTS
jgi:hypothetical protein